MVTLITVIIIFICLISFFYADIKRRIDRIEPIENIDTPFQKGVVYKDKIDYDTINAIMNIIENQYDYTLLTLIIQRKKLHETLYTTIDIASNIEISNNDIKIQKVNISRYKKLKSLYEKSDKLSI